MGLIVRALTRRNIFAIVVGVLLAGAPLLAFDFWLGGADRSAGPGGSRHLRQARHRTRRIPRHASQSARSTIWRRAASIAAEPSDIEAMRQAAFDTTPIKEIAIVGPDGRDVVHRSRPAARPAQAGRRRNRWSAPTGIRSTSSSLRTASRMVRLRRKVGGGPNAVAALVPAISVPAAGVHPRRPVQRLCAYRHRRMALTIGNIGARPDAADGRFAAPDEIRKIRFRRRNIDAARPRDRRPRGVAVARPVRHRRHYPDPRRVLHADAAAHARQSGDRDRTRAAGRRIRALLPADRRHPLRPIARRRSPGALAQARRHAGAARLVHSARRVRAG